jgi:hypothetical protein
MNRMNMKAEDRSKLAAQNMDTVLRSKYGSNYWDSLMGDYVVKEML